MPKIRIVNTFFNCKMSEAETDKMFWWKKRETNLKQSNATSD